jgi:hypothetical protein
MPINRRPDASYPNISYPTSLPPPCGFPSFPYARSSPWSCYHPSPLTSRLSSPFSPSRHILSARFCIPCVSFLHPGFFHAQSPIPFHLPSLFAIMSATFRIPCVSFLYSDFFHAQSPIPSHQPSFFTHLSLAPCSVCSRPPPPLLFRVASMPPPYVSMPFPAFYPLLLDFTFSLLYRYDNYDVYMPP